MNLESDTEHHAIFIHPCRVFIGRSPDYSADHGGRTQQRACLVHDHAYVIIDGHIFTILEIHVKTLTLVHTYCHCIERVKHLAEMFIGNTGYELCRKSEHSVAGKNRGVDIPFGMNRRTAATSVGIIHHVIMQECKIMIHLNTHRRTHSCRRITAERIGSHQHECRAKSLASSRQCIGYGVI